MNYKDGITANIFHHQAALTLSGWWPFFESILHTSVIKDIDNQLIVDYQKDFDIFPKPEDIFKALILTPLTEIKVIIIGQDPYPTPGCACGLAFSIPNDYPYKSPPSLINIFKELRCCGYKCNDNQGDLTRWAEQGVILINTALTVLSGRPNSHKKCWQKFTEKLFEYLSNHVNRAVVVMWGKAASSYSFIFKKFYLLQCAHPSPLAGNKFAGNRHFNKVNEKLNEWKVKEIDWNLN